MPGLRQLVLVGGGGTTADVLSLIHSINSTSPVYGILGILDDSLAPGATKYGVSVLGRLEAGGSGEFGYVDCLGSPGSHARRETLLRERGFVPEAFESIIHPSAYIAHDSVVGPGCLIYPNVVILAGVTLGAHVTILANSVLNHEVEVAPFSILASGVNVSGRVRIGRAAYIGCGASLREGVHIGDGSLVGLGSAVIRDVPERVIVAGNPARYLRCQR